MGRTTRRRNITGKRKRSLGGNRNGTSRRTSLKIFRKGPINHRPSALRRIYARGDLRRQAAMEEREREEREAILQSFSGKKRPRSRSLSLGLGMPNPSDF
jgi:hypothetical protein